MTGDPQRRNRPCHRNLRAIGQVLETYQLSNFDVTCKGESYLVSGQPVEGTVLQALLWKWQKGRRKVNVSFEQSYTPRDIEVLERQGRAKRQTGRRHPDFYQLPNVLRTVGAYLDMKEAQLLQIRKHNLTLMILYQTSQGHPEVEERTIASFYNFFLNLYQTRSRVNSS